MAQQHSVEEHLAQHSMEEALSQRIFEDSSDELEYFFGEDDGSDLAYLSSYKTSRNASKKKHYKQQRIHANSILADDTVPLGSRKRFGHVSLDRILYSDTPLHAKTKHEADQLLHVQKTVSQSLGHEFNRVVGASVMQIRAVDVDALPSPSAITTFLSRLDQAHERSGISLVYSSASRKDVHFRTLHRAVRDHRATLPEHEATHVTVSLLIDTTRQCKGNPSILAETILPHLAEKHAAPRRSTHRTTHKAHAATCSSTYQASAISDELVCYHDEVTVLDHAILLPLFVVEVDARPETALAFRHARNVKRQLVHRSQTCERHVARDLVAVN